MAFVFGKKSKENLKDVHPALVKIATRALELSPIDFRVSCGVRTMQQQKAMVARGVSKTMKSKHLVQSDGYAHAIDIVALPNGVVSWDFSHYRTIAGCFKQAAEEIGTEAGVTCTWGGDWATLRDGPHFQIDVKKRLK